MDKVLSFTKKLIAEKLDKNAIVVDATCGNGADTLFLAKKAKKVYAFDIQPTAITNTKNLLNTHQLLDKCELILDSHIHLDKYINEKIHLAMFNLGYLPKADHSITTLGENTKIAVEKILKKLVVGGRIAIVVYWGHPNGKLEKEILETYLSSLNQKFVEVLKYQFINQKNYAPFLIVLEKIKEEIDD